MPALEQSSNKLFSNDLSLKDRLYFISSFGYGDTMILAGYKNAIEEQYGAKIHFIIKPEHEVVMKIFGITDYSLKSFNNSELKAIAQNNNEIKLGELYIAHPMFAKGGKEILDAYCKGEFNFLELYIKNLNLSQSAKFQKPIYTPQINKNLENKIKEIAPINKIILLSPEAFSSKTISNSFWEREVERLTSKGFIVVSSVLNKENAIKGTIYLDLNMEEAIALGLNCADVYAIRSGFVDLFVLFSNKINIVYPDVATYDSCNFGRNFNNKEVNEIVIMGTDFKKIGPFLQYEDKGYEKILKFCLSIFRIKRKNKKTKYYLFGLTIFEREDKN